MTTDPLNGIQILDLTTVIMGPYATHILADMGADVIKIEAPEGDAFRRYGPSRSEGMGGSILQLHRNKHSVVLDLKSVVGRLALDRLIERSDVIVHNLRPGPAVRLRLDWKSVEKVNPKIVLCAARGFGAEGPYADKAAYDDIIQAGSGIAALYGQVHGVPKYVPTAICDKIAGQTIAYAVLAALLHIERGGDGQEIEVPMFETSIDFMMAEHLGPSAFEPPLGPVGFNRQLSVHRKPYKTADGWICILPYSDRNWADFFRLMEMPALFEDPRFADIDSRGKNVDALYALIDVEAPKRSTDDWVSMCDSAGIPCMPVISLQKIDEDLHVRAVGLIESSIHPTEGAYRSIRPPVTFGASPYKLRKHAPRLGEDSERILSTLGLSPHDLRQLLPHADHE
ncbi:CoA transferase [Glaciimonas sp. CA11.2]|uniref:CaiB/BaiF CoA transferase family protein n=1 Tax=unclassified Glaciimonas TaxID=2644401 RepID=UPI002AB5641F|nr:MULTISPECIES: CoA transferase [unclassified Glaciimonas]MDY7547100.1 CoA transferase [Glaciimonas sp. CA11.2]MEB0011056.1 CoA transferase [Glaciimonas sp. Cout2]MEB0081267.1 CoA transferase [Glaciimonas sp. Gout2]MEB0161993.1 CoA transferase [Glaciimonas sp. CA11.2]